MRTSIKYETIELPSLNKGQLKEIEELKQLKDNQINLDDICEASENELKYGKFYYADSLKTTNIK